MSSKALKKAINSLPPKVGLSQTERATKIVEEASRVRLQDLKGNPGSKVQVSISIMLNFIINVDLGTFGDSTVPQSRRSHYWRASTCS